MFPKVIWLTRLILLYIYIVFEQKVTDDGSQLYCNTGVKSTCEDFKDHFNMTTEIKLAEANEIKRFVIIHTFWRMEEWHATRGPYRRNT